MESVATTAPEAEPAPAAPEPRKESWWGLLRFLLVVFVCALLLRSCIAAPFSIPSSSMLPRLFVGDYLFVNKWSYGYSRYSFPWGMASFQGRFWAGTPARGDVVVFRYPGQRNEDLVKRVIGLPGDTIEVREGVVILNGAPLPRQRIADFALPVSPNSPCRGRMEGAVRETDGPDGTRVCLFPRFRETLPDGTTYEVLDQVLGGDTDNFGPVTVPEGYLFMMGDNRDDSSDSRVPVARGGVGLLPIDNVIGRVMITFWSTDGTAEWIKPWTWFGAARWDRFGATG